MSIKNKPLISVVLSSYNHEDYITECVESIIHQSYGWENIQLITIDDNSNDNTGAILEELSKKYNFQFVQNKTNKGLVINRNKMLKQASGKYICGCGSDDYWHKDRIQKQVDYMETHPEYAMCYGKVYYVNGEKITKDLNKNYKSGRIFEDILLMKFHMPAPTYMFRGSVFKDVGYYDESLRIEDWYMSLKISSKFEIGFIDDHLSYYRIHDTNVSRNYQMLFENQWQILNQHSSSPYFKKALKNFYLRKFYLYSSNKKKESIKLIFKAMKSFSDPRFVKGLFNLIFKKSGKAKMYKS